MTAKWVNGGRLLRATIVAAALLASWPARASDLQPPVDRSDPSVAVEEAEQSDALRPPPPERPDISSEAPAAETPAQTLVAGAIRVDGATALTPAAFAPAIEPYLGRTLSPEDLRRLVRDVADVARRAGYGLATAWIPPQSVTNGILRVQIDEGRIDAIDARGPAAEAVSAQLDGLAGSGPVRTAKLERRLLIAGALSGVTVRRARLVREGERNILRVDTRFDRVRGQFSLDNWGTSSLGPVRARLTTDISGVATSGDRLTLGAMTTPFEPREFQFLQAGYALPIGRDGTQLSLSTYWSRSGAGGALRNLDLDGDAVQAELSLSHSFIRSRVANLWGYLDLSLRDSNLDRDGAKIRDDRIATASASLYGWARAAGGAVRVRLALVQGLDAFDATERGDRLASRRDASGVFTKATFWADFTRSLGRGFSVQVSGQGQLATRPLLASEETGLGGRAFLRGYDYREFSGDRGGAGAIELRYDLRAPVRGIRRVQFYTYADAGRVTNLEGGFGSGSLVSAGGGIRFSLPYRTEVGIELGVPLKDGFGGERPDPRFSFTLATRF